MARFRALAACVCLLLLAGCSHWRPDGLVAPGPPAGSALPAAALAPLPAPRPSTAAFDYVRRPDGPPVELSLEERRNGYRVWHLWMPSAGDNGQPGRRVEGRYYESVRPGAKPLVVVLPIYGKSAYPSRKLARYLTRARTDAADVNVLRLLGNENLYRPELLAAARDEGELVAEIEATARRMVATVVDVRRLLDWAERRPEVDRDRLGVVGFSFSSALASLAMAADPRFGAGVFFMGGGHVHEIFAHCHGNEVADARQVLRRALGRSDDQLARLLDEPLAMVDPVRLAPLLAGRPVLLADSPIDRVIPESSRRDLWEALGRPQRLVFRLSHRTAFLTMTPLGLDYANRKIRRFLDESL